MSWIEAPAKTYKLIPQNLRQSNCQIEAEISYRDLVAHKPEGEWAKMAPLRILSFDIECAGRKGIFPEANVDPVIQIASMVTRQGASTTLSLFLSFFSFQANSFVMRCRRKQALCPKCIHAQHMFKHRRLPSIVIHR